MAMEAMIVQIAKLELKPGDTLVVSTDECLRMEQAHNLQDFIKHLLPEGVKVMVLDRGMTVTRLTTPEAA